MGIKKQVELNLDEIDSSTKTGTTSEIKTRVPNWGSSFSIFVSCDPAFLLVFGLGSWNPKMLHPYDAGFSNPLPRKSQPLDRKVFRLSRPGYVTYNIK